MPARDLVAHGQHVLTVCNACRYCEQYCPVFPAIEARRTFSKADLNYLANLCHNCGECLYACQYAPPHEFGIDVPRTLARIRLSSYEEYCWPRALGAAFRHHGPATAISLAAALILTMVLGTWTLNPSAFQSAPGDFYAVVPYPVMVSLFGAVFLFVLAALGIGVARFWRDVCRVSRVDSVRRGGPSGPPARAGLKSGPYGRTPWRGLRDALTLRHLHATGVDCTDGEERRSAWRRRFHHATFYGFMLCFASTIVAAIYHNVFGWPAPYAYSSVPVILGTIGGVGLIVGPAGLWILARRRDPMLADPDRRGLDTAFILLLFLSSATGLLLLALRDRTLMAPLLVVHLGIVLALLLTLPYGKFVHGIYRVAALMQSALEQSGRRT